MHRSIWTFTICTLAITSLVNAASVPKLKENDLDYQCIGNGEYNTFDRTSCKTYIHCNNGQAERKSCGWFFEFDKDFNKCVQQDWMFGNVNCPESDPLAVNVVTEPSDNSISTGAIATTTVATAATTSDITTPPMYKCKDNSHYTTYDPTSCDKYIECNNGQPQRKSCGYFRRYDENTNTCVIHTFLFGNANCSEVMQYYNSTTETPSSGSSTTVAPVTIPTSPSNGGGNKTTGKPGKNSSPLNSYSLPVGLFFIGVLIIFS